MHIPAGGEGVTLDCNDADAAGGVGQYVLGTFTADAETELVTLTGGASTAGMINGMQLRAVPEPPIYGLLGAGALAGIAFVRRRRRA